jgi:hypothetical protein
MPGALTVALLTSALAWAAPAPEEPPGPPPIPTRAHLQHGKVVIEVTAVVTVYQTVPRTVTELVNGVPVTKTYAVNVPRQVVEKRLVAAGDDLLVFDAAGVRVPRDRLPELLKGGAAVLLSADGKPVGPSHLRTAKPGTLVFVLPSYKAPAAPPSGPPPENPAAPGEGEPQRP